MTATKTQASKQHSLQYGSTTIYYSVVQRKRNTLGIEVHPNGQVLVLAPDLVAEELVQKKIQKRASWILRQQRQYTHYPPPETKRQFISGETHRYLGKQYRLKIMHDPNEHIKLQAGFLQVYAAAPNRVNKLVDTWFKIRTEQVLTERFKVCQERLGSYGIIHAGSFKIKRMAQRWGSCTANGTIYLNPLLIRAPKECIDYVIVHELVHTVHLHHQKDFYTLLTRCLPNWRSLKKKLNSIVEIPISTA